MSDPLLIMFNVDSHIFFLSLQVRRMPPASTGCTFTRENPGAVSAATGSNLWKSSQRTTVWKQQHTKSILTSS